MAIYDLYGFLSDNIQVAKEILETSLSIQFEARDSDYQGGGYYKGGKTGGENFVLKNNIDPIDGEPAEISFPEYKILLYVNNTLSSAELQKKISTGEGGFFLLRREEFK